MILVDFIASVLEMISKFFNKIVLRKRFIEIPSDKHITDFFLNKKIFIVGGTAGIGRALAIKCIALGAQVTIVGRRSPDQALEKAKFVQKDLSLMKNAITVKPEPDVDIVVFTNGIVCTPTKQVTTEGVERDLATSFLSRLAVTRSFSKLKPTAKVFVMGYPGVETKANLEDFNSEKGYSPITAHMNTVVANEALIDHIYEQYKLDTYGLNPGLIVTDIRNTYLGTGILSWFVETLIYWTNPTADQYASRLVKLFASQELEAVPKQSFSQNLAFLTPNSFAVKHGKKIIELSNDLLNKALK